MQVRKWLKWRRPAVSEISIEAEEPPQILTKNEDAPESAAKFLRELDLDEIRARAKQLYMQSEGEAMQEIVADRLLLAMDAFEEIQEQVTELEDRLASQHSTATRAIQAEQQLRNAAESKAHEVHGEINRLRNTIENLTKSLEEERNKYAERERQWPEFKNALLQISGGVCNNSKMVTGACSAAYPKTPGSWCGVCLSRAVLKQFEK